ncbi:hypothetical protein N665_0864s0010 [Sinapis alba]|nr:hypothetical protein N665_0864s0010 [Sinapis alba]
MAVSRIFLLSARACSIYGDKLITWWILEDMSCIKFRRTLIS